MKAQVAMVQERTAGIEDADKPSVMYIGLRNDDGVGVVGENFGDAKFSTEYANIQNVYEESARTTMSAEQIITLDPDDDPVYQFCAPQSGYFNDRSHL